ELNSPGRAGLTLAESLLKAFDYFGGDAHSFRSARVVVAANVGRNALDAGEVQVANRALLQLRLDVTEVNHHPDEARLQRQARIAVDGFDEDPIRSGGIVAH